MECQLILGQLDFQSGYQYLRFEPPISKFCCNFNFHPACGFGSDLALGASGSGFQGSDLLDPMRPFIEEFKMSHLVLVRRKSDAIIFSPLMGPKVTSDLP